LQGRFVIPFGPKIFFVPFRFLLVFNGLARKIGAVGTNSGNQKQDLKTI
jgi:hypothetical protein